MMQIQSSRTQIEIVSEGQGTEGIHSIKSMQQNYVAMKEN